MEAVEITTNCYQARQIYCVMAGCLTTRRTDNHTGEQARVAGRFWRISDAVYELPCTPPASSFADWSQPSAAPCPMPECRAVPRTCCEGCWTVTLSVFSGVLCGEYRGDERLAGIVERIYADGTFRRRELAVGAAEIYPLAVRCAQLNLALVQ